MKVRALRTDESLGITEGEVYSTKVERAIFGDVIVVLADAHQLFFDEEVFEVI